MAVVEAKLHDMINELDGEDYKMAVSFVQYLSEMRKKRKAAEKKTICADEGIEGIVDSLIGILPDEGMNLDDYRAERLKRYEIID